MRSIMENIRGEVGSAYFGLGLGYGMFVGFIAGLLIAII